jgi:hypothetical protein
LPLQLQLQLQFAVAVAVAFVLAVAITFALEFALPLQLQFTNAVAVAFALPSRLRARLQPCHKKAAAKRPTVLPKAGVKPEGRNDKMLLLPLLFPWQFCSSVSLKGTASAVP